MEDGQNPQDFAKKSHPRQAGMNEPRVKAERDTKGQMGACLFKDLKCSSKR